MPTESTLREEPLRHDRDHDERDDAVGQRQWLSGSVDQAFEDGISCFVYTRFPRERDTAATKLRKERGTRRANLACFRDCERHRAKCSESAKRCDEWRNATEDDERSVHDARGERGGERCGDTERDRTSFTPLASRRPIHGRHTDCSSEHHDAANRKIDARAHDDERHTNGKNADSCVRIEHRSEVFETQKVETFAPSADRKQKPECNQNSPLLEELLHSGARTLRLRIMDRCTHESRSFSSLNPDASRTMRSSQSSRSNRSRVSSPAISP